LLLYVKLNKIVQKEKFANLPMVSESLTLTFNLLTGYYSRQQPSSLRTKARFCAKLFFRV